MTLYKRRILRKVWRY